MARSQMWDIFGSLGARKVSTSAKKCETSLKKWEKNVRRLDMLKLQRHGGCWFVEKFKCIDSPNVWFQEGVASALLQSETRSLRGEDELAFLEIEDPGAMRDEIEGDDGMGENQLGLEEDWEGDDTTDLEDLGNIEDHERDIDAFENPIFNDAPSSSEDEGPVGRYISEEVPRQAITSRFWCVCKHHHVSPRWQSNVLQGSHQEARLKAMGRGQKWRVCISQSDGRVWRIWSSAR
jgi:hypothetical protein